jgi:hypothetical protein
MLNFITIDLFTHSISCFRACLVSINFSLHSIPGHENIFSFLKPKKRSEMCRFPAQSEVFFPMLTFDVCETKLFFNFPLQWFLIVLWIFHSIICLPFSIIHFFFSCVIPPTSNTQTRLKNWCDQKLCAVDYFLFSIFICCQNIFSSIGKKI